MVICSIDEAQEMWCPFARITDEMGDGTYNRFSDPVEVGLPIPKQSCCIADKCMAWTWRPLGNDAAGIMLRMEMERLNIDPKIPRGYCGLAHRGPA